MSIDPITPIPVAPINFPARTLTQVTPFTYRDNLTYLDLITMLQKKMNDVVAGYSDQNFSIEKFSADVRDAINAWATEFSGNISGWSEEFRNTFTQAVQDFSSTIDTNIIAAAQSAQEAADFSAGAQAALIDSETFVQNIVDTNVDRPETRDFVGGIVERAVASYARVPWVPGSDIYPEQTNTNKIAGWGSSTLAAMASGLVSVATEFNISYKALAKGGERFQQTEARLGSRPALLTVTGDGNIPAAGAIAVTASNMTAGNQNLQSFVGTLAGVRGTLSSDGSTVGLTFTRSQAGDVTPVPPNTPFIPEIGPQERDAVTILNLGKNNFGTGGITLDDIIESHHRAFRYLVPLVKRVIVLGHFANRDDTPERVDEIRTVNVALKKTYGALYLDVQEWMCSPSVWFETQITPNSSDTAAQAAGTKPPSLSADSAHFNTAGVNALVQRVRNKLIDLEWYSDIALKVHTSDSFSGANTLNVHGRTPNNALGGTATAPWESSLTGVDNGCYAVEDGKLVRGPNTTAGFAGLPVPTADVQIDLTVTDRPTTSSISVRRSALAGGSSSRYEAFFESSGRVNLRRVVAGASTTISDSFDFSDGATIGLRAIGNRISLLINGQPVTTIVDTAINAAGYAGIAAATGTTDPTVIIDDVRIRVPA